MCRLLWTLPLLVLVCGCLPTLPPQQLPQDCRAEQERNELVGTDWRQQQQVWRLRQTALFDFGYRKLALACFVRFHSVAGELRMIAINELGLVMFDLQVDNDGETLHRAIPQLKKREKLMADIAGNLRRIFLTPLPSADDSLEHQDYVQILSRTTGQEKVRFVFDCQGDLRQSSGDGGSGRWRILYNRYADWNGLRLPNQTLLSDESGHINLSLELKEVKQES